MRLNIGVIGCGAIGLDHVRRCSTIIRSSEIVAVHDIDTSRVGDALAYSPSAVVTETAEALINLPDVEAVLITSPAITHAPYVTAALKAGKYVFCEKPLATTTQACRHIMEVEMAGGRRLLQVGFMRRYDAGYRALKDAVQGGRLGEVIMVHAAHRNLSLPRNFQNSMAITECAIHEIDIIRWLIGDEFTSAQVIFPRQTALAPPHLRDPQLILLQSANGVRVDLEVFMNCQYGYDIQCTLVGELGVANLPEPSAVAFRTNEQVSSAIMPDWQSRFQAAFDLELQEFVDRASEGKLRGPSAWDAYVAALAADACIQAQASGGLESIPSPMCPDFYLA